MTPISDGNRGETVRSLKKTYFCRAFMKRILIITYYWPPAGGPGVQRWLHFVRYLPQYQIEPTVLIPENPFYPIQDTELLKEIPAGVRILKIPISEPYRWAKLFSAGATRKMSSGILPGKKAGFLEKCLLFIRGNFFVPDARVGWVNPVVAFLKDYLPENHIDTIVTTGPPHSLHLIGSKLKKQFPLSWIADFRDPWTAIGYHRQLRLLPWARKKHKKLEKAVLQEADAFIVTSQLLKKQFEKRTQKPIVCVTNGFEPPIKSTYFPVEKPAFVLLHTGSLLTGRNTPALWQALAEFNSENEEFSQLLRIRLVGVVSESIVQNIKTAGLEDNLEVVEYQPHDKILQLQQQAAVLLLAEIDTEETRLIIPGKLFEYYMAKRPILAIGPRDWEVEQMLNETQSGKYFNHSDVSGIKNQLKLWFELHLAGKNQVATTGIEKYSRKNLTGQLAEFIHQQHGYSY